MNNDLYCSLIHGGLELNFKGGQATAQHCCLRPGRFNIDPNTDFWKDPKFIPLRKLNDQNRWAPGCENCESVESIGLPSFRTGMNSGLSGSKGNLSGPTRIDLMFDISCNIACRTCGTHSSTFWQKHLKQHNEWTTPISVGQNHSTVIAALEQLDLSNLQMLVFSGGETLLGNSHWEVAKWLADHVPNAQQQLTLCFQTNGTQPINPRNYEVIHKFRLVKLHLSLDGVGEQFEYLRWPASWNQVVDNILEIRNSAPSNMMFHIEETVSIFNLYYTQRLESWAQKNFAINREGDVVNHNKHVAHGTFALANCTQEYVNAMQQSEYKNLIPKNWKENPSRISAMMDSIRKFDTFRSQSFAHTFPEVAKFYARYL
jgi:sulfatase maturation enzyme AslB (radical SAM superfamily)